MDIETAIKQIQKAIEQQPPKSPKPESNTNDTKRLKIYDIKRVSTDAAVVSLTHLSGNNQNNNYPHIAQIDNMESPHGKTNRNSITTPLSTKQQKQINIANQQSNKRKLIYAQDNQIPRPSKTHLQAELREIRQAIEQEYTTTTTTTLIQDTFHDYEDTSILPKGKQPLKGPPRGKNLKCRSEEIINTTQTNHIQTLLYQNSFDNHHGKRKNNQSAETTLYKKARLTFIALK
ncbi:hypothetical protein CHS0354_008785 [Potamilus streckersoni]|uniref:Uncharacterized protein n=1 Tax=Potamilus streckersoni TaxID=2493646 RepID=A0AAE0SP06_9BIVA|nr:hypothetical protein CHS0354_008785 [Potamilus streckersoni]